MTKTRKITAILALLAVISIIVGLAPYRPEPKTETAASITEPPAETAPAETTVPEPTETPDNLYRGHWLDCQGRIIWYSKGTSRAAVEKYDECFANLISDASEVKLDETAEPYLRDHNPTPILAEDDFHLIGRSMQMTIDADKQLSAYELLRKYDIKGSITVLNADGSIACAASYPSFSHNSYIKDQEGTKTEVDCFNHQSFVNAASGSVFKIASGTLAAKYGILKMQDLGFCPTYEYSNWDYKDHPARYPCERTLQQALLNSSNYWFGQVFHKLGASRVSSDLKAYFAFDSEIHSDFGTLTQDMPLASNADLVRAGFGQRMAASPLYLAAVGNAVVTGEMCRPHLFSHTVDSATLSPLETIWNDTVLCTVPAEYTAPVLEGMELVTADLGLYMDEGKTLFTKSGTAEINTEMYTDFLYLLCVVRDDASGETQSILLQVQNPQELGYEYARNAAPVMQEILQIFN